MSSSASSATSTEAVTVTAQRANVTSFGSPEVFVDIYPYEGGPYSINGGQILRCQIMKDIKAPTGEFVIQFAPESLQGNLSWGQILTPLSLVVIGTRRGGLSSVTMIGVLTKIEENQTWTFNNATLRTITVQGKDLAYFFTMNDYYTLFFLSAVSGNVAEGFGALAAGNFTGDPGTVANNWYETVMVGTTAKPGVFANMGVPYKNVSLQANTPAASLMLSALLGVRFDLYDVKIPFADYFLGVNGAWIDKFKLILPFPFYEFFVTTDSSNAYASSNPGTILAGTPLASIELGAGVTATPKVVGRINPVPALKASTAGGSGNTIAFDSIDVSQWNALPAYDMQGLNFIESSIRFSDDTVLNFYNINFPYMTGLTGADNGNYTLPIFNYASAGDKASINRYGYRPLDLSIQWFADPTGAFAKSTESPGTTLQQVYATLIGRVAGYYEATPLMAEADVRLVLRPDIQIGTKFTYTPYLSGEMWDFYVEGVMHEYIFGGESSTRLRLTRGLPSSVYQDSGTGGLLFAIHTGNAQRIGGKYQIGLPTNSAAPLQGIPINQFAQWMQNIAKPYITPQFTAPPPASP